MKKSLLSASSLIASMTAAMLKAADSMQHVNKYFQPDKSGFNIYRLFPVLGAGKRGRNNKSLSYTKKGPGRRHNQG
jgi:hypothetical protein